MSTRSDRRPDLLDTGCLTAIKAIVRETIHSTDSTPEPPARKAISAGNAVVDNEPENIDPD
jgi:hypothetical protein